MFKVLQYFFWFRLYKKAKKQFLILAIALIVMVFSSLVINDLIAVVNDSNLYFLIGLKWGIVFISLILSVMALLKIIRSVNPWVDIDSASDSVDGNTSAVCSKKEAILQKDRLLTKSEKIMRKYIK